MTLIGAELPRSHYHLLGLLAEEADYGKNLLRRLEEHPNYAESDLSKHRVYKNLRRLLELGLVEKEKKGRTKMYHVTESGRAVAEHENQWWSARFDGDNTGGDSDE